MNALLDKIFFRSNNLDHISKKIKTLSKQSNVNQIFDIIRTNSPIGEIRYVGGCIRKILCDEIVDDIDLATNLEPKKVCEIFEKNNIKYFKSGIEHGTITAFIDKKKFEITSLRKDVLSDGRHAKVKFSRDWKEDASRRDFTINSIYSDDEGNLFDPFNGKIDLKNGHINFIGNPEKRIKEDYLRILRFLRFSVQYQNFDINDQIQKAVKLNLNGITKLSKERIYSELEKIIKLKNFYDLFKNKFLLDIFKLIFPEFIYLDRIKKFEKLSKVKDIEIDKDVIFASMLLDFSNNHEYFFYKYNISNEIKNNLNLYSKLLKEIKSNEDFFLKDLKKNIFFYGRDQIKKMFLIHNIVNKKTLSSKTKETLLKISHALIPKFPVTGNDLLKQGVQSGRKVGEILKKIEKKWIENNFEINNEEIKDLVKRNV